MQRFLLPVVLLLWLSGCAGSPVPQAEPRGSSRQPEVASLAGTGEMPWPQEVGQEQDAPEQREDVAPFKGGAAKEEQNGVAKSIEPTLPLPLPLGRVSGPKVIALDPGHGGEEIGAAYTSSQGWVVREKDVNLAVALKLRQLLEQAGFPVVLTRDGDRRAYALPPDQLPPDTPPSRLSFSRTRADLQARIDLANAANADLFIALHANGSPSPATSGVEVWYDGSRPFAQQNLALAQAVHAALLQELRAIGYQAVDRGVKEDSTWRTFRGRSFPLFVLGPPRTEPNLTRATQMPGILGETLFLSNPTEAALLGQEEAQWALARGYLKGILHYFQGQE